MISYALMELDALLITVTSPVATALLTLTTPCVTMVLLAALILAT